MASDSAPNVPYVIRSRRIMLGLSQARLAELVGRTATTVRRWERGEVAPPDDVIDELATALEVDAARLRPPPPPKRSSVVVGGPAGLAPPEDPAGPASDATRLESATPVTRPQRAAAPPPGPAPSPGAGEPWISIGPQATPPAPAAPTPTPAAPAAAPAPSATATASRPTPAPPVIDDPDATAAVPPPRRPVARAAVVTPRSYLEDPKQRLLYSIRLILTLVALATMAVIAVWAAGELLGALDETLDFFSETTLPEEPLLPTLPGAES